MGSPTAIETIKKQVDALNSEAWEVRVSDSAKAFELSKEAIELARSIAYKKGMAEGLRTYGFSHIRLSRHQEAQGLLQESLRLFQELKDLRGQSDVYEYYGIIYRSYGDFNVSLEYLYKALELRLQTDYQEGASLSYYHLGVTYKYLGNYEKALEYLLQSLIVGRAIKYWVAESYALNLLGQIYFETNDFQQALDYYEQSLQIRKDLGDKWGEAGCLDNIGYTHFKLSSLREAIDYCSGSLTICRSTGDKKGQGNALFHLGEIYKQNGEDEKAYTSADESLQIRKDINDKKGQAEVLLFLASLSLVNTHDLETPLHLLKEALLLGNDIKALDLLAKTHLGFYQVYKQFQRYEDALASFELYNQIEKELHKDALAAKVQNLETTHRAEQAQKEAEIYRLRNVELANLYEEIKKQKEETEIQKQKVEVSLIQLKETQAQLVQKEKMASLGELTAGIAHEIQNPLNFVNNFSEMNKELIEEVEGERAKANGDRDEELEAEILSNIKQNLEKVLHHGKRADAIVKGMLQHSRANTGKKEPTDMNALAEEYVRLAYHGMRAKDKTFTATIETQFDESIGMINVVPQDIGRVLLNLYNNAFYAVQQKKQQAKDEYEPAVFISTKKSNHQIEMHIKDNGTGIPQKIIDKIFQPFFTTKPTGQGTGLGLSLSYDIIKVHDGAIKVESKEGEETTFIIRIPIQ